jgi:hypothetical protein
MSINESKAYGLIFQKLGRQYLRLRLLLLHGKGSAVRASRPVPPQVLAHRDTTLVASIEALANYPSVNATSSMLPIRWISCRRETISPFGERMWDYQSLTRQT